MRRDAVLIEPFLSADAGAFASLNRDWLVGYDLLEEADEEDLSDPERSIIGNGGEIFMARIAGATVGCGALLAHGEGTFELGRVAVDPGQRGRGVGRRLVERCIERARERGGRRLILVSNSRLVPALRLYESIGFRSRPVPADVKYRTADVYMELELRQP